MKAVHCTRYGGPEVLELKEVPVPAPKPDQVLIRVHAASVTLGDCELRKFQVVTWAWVPLRLAMGITRPRQPVLGMEVAGDVVAIGEKVTRFRVGDRVSGSSAFAMGAYQEFVALPETAALSPIPPALSYAEVVGIPTGGFNGLHFVRQCALQPGEKLLVNGAAGSIGLFAVQLAKQAGAEVTAVDHGDKHAMLRGLGADHLLDYRHKDFWVTNERYDAIIDIVGNVPVPGAAAILTDGGRLMLGNPKAGQVVAGIAENRRGRVKVLFKLAGEPLEDLDWLKAQVAEKHIKMVIDRRFPLAALAEAHRYVDSGQKTGIVVIDVSGAADTRGPPPPA